MNKIEFELNRKQNAILDCKQALINNNDTERYFQIRDSIDVWDTCGFWNVRKNCEDYEKYKNKSIRQCIVKGM